MFFSFQTNSETIATFSLPAGLSYPVQIPAGVTLQTASGTQQNVPVIGINVLFFCTNFRYFSPFLCHWGQLYKVNVPVVVTQAPAGQPLISRTMQRVFVGREAPAPQSYAVPPKTTRPQGVDPPSVPASSLQLPPHSQVDIPPCQEKSVPQPPQVPAAEPSQLQGVRSPEPNINLEENEQSPQREPVNLSMNASPCSQLLEQISSEETLTQTAQFKSRDIDDILKEVIEEEREKAERARNLAPAKNDNQSDPVLGVIWNEYTLGANTWLA